MSQKIITKLTKQEEQLCLIVRQKWLNILKQGLEKEKKKKIINKIYKNEKYEVPKIIFTDSPKSAYRILKGQRKNNQKIGLQINTLLNEEIECNLRQKIQSKLRGELQEELQSMLVDPIRNRIYYQFWLPLENQITKQFGKKKEKISFDLTQFSFACYLDFLQQIGIDFEREYYDIYIDFFTNISLYLAFENLVVVIERPMEINWNEKGKLHAEGKPAIKFQDDFSIYAYNGTQLPAKYGKLNPEQWASRWLTEAKDSELNFYIEKWRKICFSTERINFEKVIQAVKEIYKLMDYPKPEICLFDSPGAVIQKMDSEETFLEVIGKSLAAEFRKKFGDIFWSSLQNQLGDLWLELGNQICKFTYFYESSVICNFLETKMNFLWTYKEEDYENCDEDEDFNEEFSFSVKNSNRMRAVSDCNMITHYFVILSQIDFCASELKCTIELQKWNAFKKLMTHCGSVWFYENTCIICHRPSKISFDQGGRLHGEGSPAITFSDGFSVYAFQNVWLPEKYGKVHPTQWNSAWLLENNPADLTQILLENIGYERINRELNQNRLTAQDKYELLKTNLYDKVDLTKNIVSSQEIARNYIDWKSLPSYEFETVTINLKGKIVAKDKNQARVFTEDLGNNISLEMVAIPGGEFLMGTVGSDGEEQPQHSVKVSPFFMSKYPITQAQWRAVASMPKVKLDLDPEPSHFPGDTRPVERITKEEAIEFCARLWQHTGKLYCLPSEAQWEYACRANTITPFHFGETITTNLANYNGKYLYEHQPVGIFRQETLPVGSFPPNAFGLYDMHGNVFEFCADNWHHDYQDAPNDYKSRTGGSDEYVSIRGGGWKSLVFQCRSANRNDEFRNCDIIYSDVGFRVAIAINNEHFGYPFV